MGTKSKGIFKQLAELCENESITLNISYDPITMTWEAVYAYGFKQVYTCEADNVEELIQKSLNELTEKFK